MGDSMDAITGRAASQARAMPERSRFFARTAWLFLALVLLSFPLTYYGPMLRGTKQFSTLRHIHGLFFFAWMGLYVWQAQLVVGRKVARHREVGLFGLMLAGSLVIMGVWMAIVAAHDRAAAGRALPYEFTVYNLTDIACFTGFLLAAIATATKRYEWHRRFMFIATLNLVAPAFSRIVLLAPLEWPWLDMAPSLGFDLFLLLLAWHDRRTLGRVHPATRIAIALMVPLHIAGPFIARSDWWNALAPRLMG